MAPAASAAWRFRWSWPLGDDAARQGRRGAQDRDRQDEGRPGTDNSNDMGPLVTRQHFEKVEGLCGQRRGRKAPRWWSMAAACRWPGHEEGYFLGACLFDHVKPGMKIYQEEIFGPGAGRGAREASLQEAMQLIDDHEYGNGTCIFTRDGEAARYFTDHIQVGMVGGERAPARARGLPLVWRLEALACSATCTPTGPTPCASTPSARPSPSAGPAPACARARCSASPAAAQRFRHPRPARPDDVEHGRDLVCFLRAGCCVRS